MGVRTWSCWPGPGEAAGTGGWKWTAGPGWLPWVGGCWCFWLCSFWGEHGYLGSCRQRVWRTGRRGRCRGRWARWVGTGWCASRRWCWWDERRGLSHSGLLGSLDQDGVWKTLGRVEEGWGFRPALGVCQVRLGEGCIQPWVCRCWGGEWPCSRPQMAGTRPDRDAPAQQCEWRLAKVRPVRMSVWTTRLQRWPTALVFLWWGPGLPWLCPDRVPKVC